MQARRAAWDLAFILFSQFDKKITNYSREDLQDIILKSVRILTSSATEELKIALGGLVAMRNQIENYEADAEENLKRPIGAANIPVPIPMTHSFCKNSSIFYTSIFITTNLPLDKWQHTTT